MPIAIKTNAVDIYGSLTSAIRAKEVAVAFINWAESSGDQIGPTFEVLRQAKQNYVFSARGDLRIVDPPDMSSSSANRRRRGETPAHPRKLTRNAACPACGDMTHDRPRDGQRGSLVGTSLTGGLVRLGAPHSHQSIGGP